MPHCNSFTFIKAHFVAAAVGAECELMSGRLVIEKDELCGTTPKSASLTFHVTVAIAALSFSGDSSLSCEVNKGMTTH